MYVNVSGESQNSCSAFYLSRAGYTIIESQMCTSGEAGKSTCNVRKSLNNTECLQMIHHVFIELNTKQIMTKTTSIRHPFKCCLLAIL